MPEDQNPFTAATARVPAQALPEPEPSAARPARALTALPAEAGLAAEEQALVEVTDEEAALPETIFADLDATTTRLAGLRAKVERLAETLQVTEAKLAGSEEQLATVSAARELELATIARLEEELARKGDLLATTKASLAELTRTLEEG